MAEMDAKVAIITGGAGGIGKATASLFVRNGAKVLITDISEEALKEAAREINSESVSYFIADVSKPEDNEAMVKKVISLYGGLDIFIANAGLEGMVKPLLEYPLDMLRKIIDTNLLGVYYGLRFAAPEIAKRGGGNIVINSSVAGLRGSPGLLAYVMSKHGLIGLMRTAALELAPMNIRINTVNPSPVETRMMRSIEEQAGPEAPGQVKKSFEESIPLKRYAQPEEIAQLIFFLASPKNTFITGGVYVIDGGMTAGL